ncbi:centromere protein M isoform X3 [Lithobates pipiens]
MAALRPFEKMPVVNAAAVLLVGSEEGHRERLAQSMLKEPKIFDVKILNNVLSSMMHLDAYFYLGKVCFLATRGNPGSVKHCAVDIATVEDLADKHLSILIQSELDNEDDVTYTAQRLLNILKICAGLVPGISSLYLGSMMKSF